MVSPIAQLAVVAMSLDFVTTATVSSLATTIETRSPPGTLQSLQKDSRQALRRTVEQAGVIQRDSNQVFTQSQSLDMSFDDATLFAFENIAVQCNTCYVKGKAIASLAVEQTFNISSTIGNFTTDVWNEIENVTDTAVNFIEDWLTNITENALDGVLDLDDYDFPTLDIDFNVEVPKMPEAMLELEFDGLEVYMLLDAVLTTDPYKLAVYPTKAFPAEPLGFKIGDDIIGVVITLDLILGLDIEAAISTGIHLNFDKVSIKIPMFENNISSIALEGGKFEFLPVTINTTGVVLDATLQLGITAGLTAKEDIIPGYDVSAGASVGMWTNLAELTTNVSLPSSLSVDGLSTGDDDSDGCSIPIVEVFLMAVGAQAGASIAVRNDTWGPSPSTQIPIFYSTVSACAATKTDSTANTGVVTARAEPGHVGRADLTTTTVSKVFTFTGVGCKSTGLVNCPVSLQTTSKYTSTSTVVTSVTSGQAATFPAAQSASVTSTMAFGSAVARIAAMSGSPTSYVPPPPSDTASGGNGNSVSIGGGLNDIGDALDGLSDQNKKLVIGLSVGIGVPLLVAITLGCWYCQTRRGYSSVPKRTEPVQGINPQAEPFLAGAETTWKKDQTTVTVTGVGSAY